MDWRTRVGHVHREARQARRAVRGRGTSVRRDITAQGRSALREVRQQEREAKREIVKSAEEAKATLREKQRAQARQADLPGRGHLRRRGQRILKPMFAEYDSSAQKAISAVRQQTAPTVTEIKNWIREEKQKVREAVQQAVKNIDEWEAESLSLIREQMDIYIREMMYAKARAQARARARASRQRREDARELARELALLDRYKTEGGYDLHAMARSDDPKVASQMKSVFGSRLSKIYGSDWYDDFRKTGMDHKDYWAEIERITNVRYDPSLWASPWRNFDEFSRLREKAGLEELEDVKKRELERFLDKNRPIIGLSTGEWTDRLSDIAKISDAEMREIEAAKLFNDYYWKYDPLPVTGGEYSEIPDDAVTATGARVKDFYAPALTPWEALTPWAEERGETIGSYNIAKAVVVMGGEMVVPFVYSARHWTEMPGWEKGLNMAVDFFSFIPGARIVSAEVRAYTAPVRAVGKAVIAEIKAPITTVIHPRQTLRSVAHPIEDFFMPGRVPIEAMENFVTTRRLDSYRLEYSGAESLKDKLKYKEMMVGKAITGDEARMILPDGFELRVPPSVATQSIEGKVLITNMDDINNALDGMTVGWSKVTGEPTGPMWFGDSVMSNFYAKKLESSNNSFFRAKSYLWGKAGPRGKKALAKMNMGPSTYRFPKDVQPGSVIIRDPDLIKKMAVPPKEWQKFMELENLAKVGIEIPPPSQIIKTYLPSGDETWLLIVGKPLSKRELVKLKLSGVQAMFDKAFKPPMREPGHTRLDYFRGIHNLAEKLDRQKYTATMRTLSDKNFYLGGDKVVRGASGTYYIQQPATAYHLHGYKGGGKVRRTCADIGILKDDRRGMKPMGVLLGRGKSDPAGVYSLIGGEVLPDGSHGRYAYKFDKQDGTSISGATHEHRFEETGAPARNSRVLAPWAGKSHEYALHGTYITASDAWLSELDHMRHFRPGANPAHPRGRPPELEQVIYWDGRDYWDATQMRWLDKAHTKVDYNSLRKMEPGEVKGVYPRDHDTIKGAFMSGKEMDLRRLPQGFDEGTLKVADPDLLGPAGKDLVNPKNRRLAHQYAQDIDSMWSKAQDDLADALKRERALDDELTEYIKKNPVGKDVDVAYMSSAGYLDEDVLEHYMKTDPDGFADWVSGTSSRARKQILNNLRAPMRVRLNGLLRTRGKGQRGRRSSAIYPLRAPARVETREPMRGATRATTRTPARAPARAPIRAPARAPLRKPIHAPVRAPMRAPGVRTKPRPRGRLEMDVPPPGGEAIGDRIRMAPVTYRQGLFWVTIYPPYKGKKDIKYTREKPQGATTVKGPGSAYETIKKLGVETPQEILFDMGVMDVHIGRHGTDIKFIPDRRQRTTLGYPRGMPRGVGVVREK
jgi:hypothetical protein